MTVPQYVAVGVAVLLSFCEIGSAPHTMGSGCCGTSCNALLRKLSAGIRQLKAMRRPGTHHYCTWLHMRAAL
jgi:hypothetical protein